MSEEVEEAVQVDMVMTCDQADAERRLGRVVLIWKDIKDCSVLLISSIFNSFLPIDIHPMGEGAYVYIGVSPLFESLADKGESFEFSDIPFYMLEMNEKGVVTAKKLDVEKNLIQAPTPEEVRKLG
jgi:hypothetical protein